MNRKCFSMGAKRTSVNPEGFFNEPPGFGDLPEHLLKGCEPEKIGNVSGTDAERSL